MNNKFEVNLIDINDFIDYADTRIPLCQTTDFGMILGAFFAVDLTTQFWLKGDISSLKAAYVNTNGKIFTSDIDSEFTSDIDSEDISIRPVLKYSLIERYAEKINYYSDLFKPFDIIKFGEYPQSCVNLDENTILEDCFKKGLVKATGKTYTTGQSSIDGNGFYKNNQEFIPYQYTEYEYEGKKYIRFDDYYVSIGDGFIDDDLIEKYNNVFWFRVEPIEWYVDKDKDLAISRFSLLSGIKYHYSTNLDDNNIKYEDTTMYNYLNTYFIKDILPNKFLVDNIKYNNNDYNDKISKKFK